MSNVSQPSATTSEPHPQDWLPGVLTDKGGYARLEDFCNRTGNGLMYTSGIVLMDEELLAHELGERVVNYIMEYEIDHWDALMGLFYAETMRKEEKVA